MYIFYSRFPLMQYIEIRLCNSCKIYIYLLHIELSDMITNIMTNMVINNEFLSLYWLKQSNYVSFSFSYHKKGHSNKIIHITKYYLRLKQKYLKITLDFG